MNSLWPPEPPRKNRLSLTLWLQVLIALIAIAAGAYFVYREFTEAGVEFRRGAPQPAESATGPAARPGPGPERSDRILTCTAEDGSTFYTNALTCDAADLDNTLNVVPSWEGDSTIGRNCLTDRPDWEQHIHFLAGCQEAFRQALNLEQYLSKAEDPVRSRRAPEYCDLIAQGVRSGCMASSDIFCYLQVCQKLAEGAGGQ